MYFSQVFILHKQKLVDANKKKLLSLHQFFYFNTLANQQNFISFVFFITYYSFK